MPDQENLRPLDNSHRNAAAGSKRIGPAAPEDVLPLTICVHARADAPVLPDQEHWEATPPAERRYLTSDEFDEQYGANHEDLEKVAQFLQGQGIRVVEKNAAQRVVLASAKVSVLEKAFSVSLYSYEGDPIEEVPRRPAEAGAKGQAVKAGKPAASQFAGSRHRWEHKLIGKFKCFLVSFHAADINKTSGAATIVVLATNRYGASGERAP